MTKTTKLTVFWSFMYVLNIGCALTSGPVLRQLWNAAAAVCCAVTVVMVRRRLP